VPTSPWRVWHKDEKVAATFSEQAYDAQALSLSAGMHVLLSLPVIDMPCRGHDVIAQGAALGLSRRQVKALKGRNRHRRAISLLQSYMNRFARFPRASPWAITFGPYRAVSHITRLIGRKRLLALAMAAG
jgi:hypothetical protein